MKRRNFIRNAALGSVAFSGLSRSINLFSPESKSSEGSRLKDNFWLWGQVPNSHHTPYAWINYNLYDLPGTNFMDVKEGCEFFGIEKTHMVSLRGNGPFPPYDKEAEKLKGLKEVVWSTIGEYDIDEVLRIADMYPNITGAVLDDFFRGTEAPGLSTGTMSIDAIQILREKLHYFPKRRLYLWMVWYDYQLDFKVSDYINLCDVITLWTWRGSNLPQLDENIQKFVEKTPDKRRLVGCYMWNYGERKPMTMDLMKYQLDRYYYWIKKGDLEGIIFCSNCIADIGLDTVEYTRKWIAEMGG